MAKRNPSSSNRKRKSEPSPCKICTAPAFYSYYGVLSCEPCKVFFRRYAENNKKVFRCQLNDQCEIDIHTRQLCPSCRLPKCFREGMKIEMIRRSMTNRKPNPASKSLVKLPTNNLLEKDNSSLNSSEWILLSNLIHNYQESKLLAISARIRSENESLQRINQLFLDDLLSFFYEIAGNSLRSNNDIAHLPAEDRSLFLHTAATNLTCLAGTFIYSHSQLINDDLFWNHLSKTYGKITMDFNRWSAKFSEEDGILCKLVLPLFTFPTNTRVFYRNIPNELTNVNDILNIQNRYAELTWKYLLYRYAHKQATLRFMNIIQWFLAVTVFMEYAHRVDLHVNDVHSLVEQTELIFILDDVDRIDREEI